LPPCVSVSGPWMKSFGPGRAIVSGGDGGMAIPFDCGASGDWPERHGYQATPTVGPYQVAAGVPAKA
jgi:hypothetical protein